MDVGDEGATDDVDATISYTNCQPAYIIQPQTITVQGGGVPMRRREANIDCTTGDLTQVRQYLADGTASITDLTYFANGNLQSVTGPTNKTGQRYTLTYAYDPIVATHVAKITDSFGLSSSATHNYHFGKVETTTDTNGQQMTYVYDTVGRVEKIYGPYEQGQAQATLSFSYAPVETPTSTADEAGSTIPLATVPWALTQHVDKDAAGNYKPSGTIDTLLFTDGLKRVLQTKKDATVLEPGLTTPVDKMTVSGQVVFDAFGRTVAQYYPTTEDKNAGLNVVYNPIQDTQAGPTTTTYDARDRVESTTLPDGSRTTIVYQFGPGRAGTGTQFETIVTDANVNDGRTGSIKHTYRDVSDLITSIQELTETGAIWTSYTYDALKQIRTVTDDKNNQTTVNYDNLGRRTSITNPDTGETTFTYDRASNLIEKATAKLKNDSQAIAYDYDFNRLIAIRYPVNTGNNVSYTYGEPTLAGDANGNRAGRITKVISHTTTTSQGDQQDTEERHYGRLGEVVYEKKTVVTFTDPLHPSVFETAYQFDTFGRLQKLTYPDGELLTNQYDSGGNLKSAASVKNGFRYNYLRNLSYDKFEQRVQLEQGNGIVTTYTYNAQTRRLHNLTAGRSGGTQFQKLAYDYDRVGNILGLANGVDPVSPNTYGGPVSQTFTYDSLYRLTEAKGTFNAANKTHTYTLALGYDSIHNIQTKTQAHNVVQPSGTPIPQKKTTYDWTYAYNGSGPDSTRPHAPTHIGERSYTYDLNGNQLGWTHDQNGTQRTLNWDEENRIQSIEDNGHEKAYKYDDQGQRTIKRGPQGETVYVNQFYTQRPGATGTKHVYAGTSRIASKLMRQDVPGANPAGKTPYEKDLYFYHPDHLGSSSYITDLNGKLYEHLQYFPFGEAWVEENSNAQRTPYHFTSKELDEETGLYYFGARYYDPRTSVWQSADPILGQYLDGNPAGGVFLSANLSLYAYVGHKPTVLHDPNGEFGIVGAFVGAVAGVAVQGAIDLYKGELSSLGAYAGAAAGGALIGATAGLGAAAVTATGATGAAATAVTTGVAVTAGAAGGATATVTEALVDDKAITGGDVLRGAGYGAVGGVVGVGAGKVVSTAVERASPAVKGIIGEAATQARYLGRGYASGGKAVVATGGQTATGRVARAHYDHAMRNVFTGTRRTVESKFGTAGLTRNQAAARGNVTTPGGLIVDRTTAGQIGDAARAAVGSGAPALGGVE
jgi:RHS repeat-associated protein